MERWTSKTDTGVLNFMLYSKRNLKLEKIVQFSQNKTPSINFGPNYCQTRATRTLLLSTVQSLVQITTEIVALAFQKPDYPAYDAPISFVGKKPNKYCDKLTI